MSNISSTSSPLSEDPSNAPNEIIDVSALSNEKLIGRGMTGDTCKGKFNNKVCAWKKLEIFRLNRF